MSAEIVCLTGAMADAAGAPNDDAIACLELFLEMARAGHLSGVAIVASTPTGKVYERVDPASVPHVEQIMAGLDCLKVEFTRDMISQMEAVRFRPDGAA